MWIGESLHGPHADLHTIHIRPNGSHWVLGEGSDIIQGLEQLQILVQPRDTATLTHGSVLGLDPGDSYPSRPRPSPPCVPQWNQLVQGLWVLLRPFLRTLTSSIHWLCPMPHRITGTTWRSIHVLVSIFKQRKKSHEATDICGYRVPGQAWSRACQKPLHELITLWGLLMSLSPTLDWHLRDSWGCYAHQFWSLRSRWMSHKYFQVKTQRATAFLKPILV